MSEQSFEIAMGDGEKTLSKVEATLKQLSIEEFLNKCGEEKIFQVDAREQNENNGEKVQGIKCKPKRKRDGSSIRPKNALEKATRKGKRRSDKLVKTARDVQAQMPEAQLLERENLEENQKNK
ncbi:hypothetical protein V6N12_064976 [Hibiscus sabdariffa]|uniref:Uncharacterized protein n=1 Tax=Hibiscus sabdariffa TaxID=183260 RepID=A0ABR2G7D1_9ROSI